MVTDISCVSRENLFIASGSKVLEWDIREKTPKPVEISLPVQSISANESQPLFLSTGCENGTVAFWDIRNTSLPLYHQKAHTKAIRRYF